ncbi:hypothetical protein AC782_07340 [Helicobacter pylori]|nr:hypothetical protein AC782_07340 [Helicobacter pylori]
MSLVTSAILKSFKPFLMLSLFKASNNALLGSSNLANRATALPKISMISLEGLLPFSNISSEIVLLSF